MQTDILVIINKLKIYICRHVDRYNANYKKKIYIYVDMQTDIMKI